ncbi:MAG: phage baseplate protein, partial [Candidatus Riflebacteria bacterium]|nr:phage baseplate protein [Candidatus Riflebacteria bacterium]
MAEYRKHWLINSLGQRYDFTEDNSKLLFSRPQGFGFRREYETIKVGNSELVMSQQFDLTDITGQLLFYRNQDAGDIYQDYRDFIGFVKFKPLMFFQLTPNDINPFYCDVLLTNIDKPDIGENGILSVNVTFHRLTEWLDAEDYTIVLTNEPTG